MEKMIKILMEFVIYPKKEPSNKVSFNGLGRGVQTREYLETMFDDTKLWLQPQSIRAENNTLGIEGTERDAIRC